MNLHCGEYALDDHGVLTARGADAVQFLQGQLSQDVTRVDAARPLLAGYHTPQGRVIALLRLLPAADGAIHCILPRELVAPLGSQLRKYILRAKLVLVDDSDALRVIGVAQPGGARTLRLAPHPGAAGHEAGAATREREAWRALEIAEGQPQVYAATSGEFVAQMLNLDCVDGIAFDKGCYTGQEIIARAHYRGRVKRRMQRFRTRAALALAPGVVGTLSDGRRFTVVDSVRADDRQEFLAVSSVPADDDRESPAADAVEGIDFESLPLPYALPR